MDAFGSAQGAVDSLLGTLASVVRDESRLLGSVRGEVQFIKDEMESMNGFLLHVDEASEEGDHQVRAWMRQVRDVAVESERWVGRYQKWAGTAPHGGGLIGFVQRIPHSVWTVWERREIATKVQELKARAQEIGERRQRYGVEAPKPNRPPVQDPLADHRGDDESDELQYSRRRCLKDPSEPDITEKDKDDLIGWLTEEGDDIPRLRVIRVLGIGDSGKARLHSKVFQDHHLASHFSCMSWISIQAGNDTSLSVILEQLLFDLGRQQGSLQHDGRPEDKVSQLLQGKRFLIVWEGINNPWTWSILNLALSFCGLAAGNAVVVLTQDSGFLKDSFYRSLDKAADVVQFYRDKAIELVKIEKKTDLQQKADELQNIVLKLYPDYFCSKLLVRLMYVKPDRTIEQLKSICDKLSAGNGWSNTHSMLRFLYDDMPADYRRCLLYLSIFPPGWKMRRTSLVRRWVAEGLMVNRAGLNALDAAERCFSALFDRGLISPCQFGASGKVKGFTVPDPVLDFIVQTAAADNFADTTNLPPQFAPYLSIGNGIQQVLKERHPWRWDYCINILQSMTCFSEHRDVPIPAADPVSVSVDPSCEQVPSRDSNPDPPQEPNTNLPCESNPDPWRGIVALLGSLPTFERQGLLKVLDLEGCTGLRKHHLKIICQVPELRYISLRGTDVTDLPKEIHKLHNLETLDIRQTKVKVLPKKFILLQRLKHLLSGHIEYQPKECANVMGSNELFTAVGMPLGVGNMTEMQILSHVQVSGDCDKLIDELARLQKLRKLGVVLIYGKNELPHSLHNLLRAIEKLSRYLRSLSVQFEASPTTDGQETAHNATNMITLPMFLESIKISGFEEGLPSWSLKPKHLVKITVRKTLLKYSDIRCLGKIASLRYLRLQFIDSCEQNVEDKLVLKKGEFVNLQFLSLEHSIMADLCFEEGAAPKLEKMHWCFCSKVINSIAGINHLKRLGEINFVGSTVNKQAIRALPYRINVCY